MDPPGCTDIDDALHCRELENGNLEVNLNLSWILKKLFVSRESYEETLDGNELHKNTSSQIEK